MITASATLQQLAQNPIRKPTAKVYIMWDGVNWTDESSRLKNVSGYEEMGGGLFQTGMSEVDIQFYNEDFHFSLNHANCSITKNQMIPKARVKVEIGFNNEHITRFNGYVESYTPDVKSGVFSIHAFDRAYIFKHTFSGYVFFENYTISELVEWIGAYAGLSASEMNIEATTEQIGFAYFEDRTLWFLLDQLAGAEGGRIFFDNDNKLTFWNRSHLNFADDPVFTFRHSDYILDQPYELSDKDIKNVIRVRSETRQVYEEQVVWDVDDEFRDEFKRVNAHNGDDDNDLQFIVVPENPVTSYTRPLVAYTDYEANSQPDGSGTDLTTDIEIINLVSFIKSIAFRIRYNSASGIAYFTKLQVRGTPAKVFKKIDTVVQNELSIGRYGTIIKEIDNPYIYDETFATSLAQTQLNMFANTLSNFSTSVVAIPWLQTGDIVAVQITPESTDTTNWLITKCRWSWSPQAGATMDLTLSVNYAEYNKTEEACSYSGVAFDYTLYSGVYYWSNDEETTADKLTWNLGKWS